ncbi:2-oxoacid:acceptor oxidoreductase family protein [Pyrobaculum neutrophilum]|uniref:pyruvate synthase n=1 Tax=Pyrobaculum neutrophilum (strain DSM 2338 / JCM 9278 / NBRC 100436 / V24Sta) TaxID=444157 RepID=B1Y9M4_PYRNV|nr:2-oxoacid:acceptor oxidoreductase family protein [Pyrobaculum neutrophilum]ACB40453.1 pyruvate/ketoisovalerate oxidoreductase, gamma subunit [Pyrobaculum neutrophilum V24Sta]
MYEVIFIGRGGQGAVTAAQLLAYVAALEGKQAQALPEFGAERRGAVVKAYLRIGEPPLHSSMKKADYVVVLDGRIVDQIDVRQYGKPNAVYIVNTKREASWYIAIDATSIAIKHGLVVAGWPVVNLIMAAAFAAVSGAVSLEGILRALPEFVPRRYVDANRNAVVEAFNLMKLAKAR